MTAENIYLYLFFVGVIFAAANLLISGFSHMFGGLGQHDGGDQATLDGGHDGGLDGGHHVSHDGGIDGGYHAGYDGGAGDTGAFGEAGVGIDSADIGHTGDMDGGDLAGIGHMGDISGTGGADRMDGTVGTGGIGGTAGTAEIGGIGGTAGTGAAGRMDGGIDIADPDDFANIHSPHSPHTPRGGTPLYFRLSSWLPIRPTALICFSAVTGGIGSIGLRLGWAGPLTHIAAVVSGYMISMLLGVALPRKLQRAQNTSAAERYELIGLSAAVTSAIAENGFGRITYAVRDNAYSAPARHIEGLRVPQGARVAICEIRGNVFYVMTIEGLT